MFKAIQYVPSNQKAITIHNSNSQIVVLLGPPRSGKSSTFTPEALFTFCKPETNIWVVGCDYKTTDRFIFGAGSVPGVYTYIRKYMPWLVGERGPNRKDHTIDSKIGSSIKGKSAIYEESFVAEKVDMIVCEDAGGYREGFYGEHLRPRILDSGGRILINSVPPLMRKNYVIKLWEDAKNCQDGRLLAIQWSLWDNPYLEKKEVESFIRDCPQHLRRALVDGIPPSDDSSVFGKVRDHAMGGHMAWESGHLYQAGIDIGLYHDRTVLTIVDLTASRVVYIDVFPERFFKTELVEERLMRALERYHFPNTYIDVSGLGETFMGMVHRHGFFIPFRIPTNAVRNQLIEELALAVNRGLTLPENEYVLHELESIDVIMKNNYYVYRPTGGAHDDSVISLALAVHGWSKRMRAGSIKNNKPLIVEKTRLIEDGFLRDDVGPVDVIGEYRL